MLQGLDAVEPEGGVHERVAAQLHAAGQRVAAAPVTPATGPGTAHTTDDHDPLLLSQEFIILLSTLLLVV